MNNSAFFFQGDMLLLPADSSGSRPDGDVSAETSLEIPLEFAKDFQDIDVFEIPAIEFPEGREASCSAVPTVKGVSVLPTAALPENWRGIAVRQVIGLSCVGMAEGRGNLGRMLRAFHIARWRQESRFCGSCGSRNVDVPGEAERRCPVCTRHEFPRISPAVIVVITDDENRILLAHNRRFKAGIYSHISGFNEAGESLEATVVREIREEVNIEVRDIAYIRSQPWPFPNSLMLGFSARYASGSIRPDGIEIEDAQWFSKDNLPELPGNGSLSRFLIDCWLGNQ